MENSIRFSVVIPLYNKENYVEATLKSVLNQRYENFEILIVNDCSTDSSLEKVNSFIDKRIKIIQHPINKGLSASRNTGIQNATADYVAFIDADDLWKPTFLEKMNSLIGTYQNQTSVFASTYEITFGEERKVMFPFPLLGINSEGIIQNFFSTSLGYNYYCMSSICANKKLFDDIGYFDERINYSEDVDFNIRLNLKHKVAFINEPLATLNFISENQITHSKLSGKVIPDYDFYEDQNPNNKELKKYLDFHRYVKAKLLKMENNNDGFKKLKSRIDTKNLNWKQKLLLRLPQFVLKTIYVSKRKLLQKGINVSSY
ncbi:glycosyltransferase family 2 protein [Aureisphaera sp. CAU 1614]|uniref:Glycosyltransferase family 2 protein n=1 Tax=Halomarinibacterium sedimenti TaxID=2857106 RepID=A0A9X1FQG7_9FLAO|nr:glycosyltransferase family 2 protein [Halomarinibacterium sedimenti]MBW2938905.1 glycosyltransferase family 2 protein [Halomarinibacterium sedimenti]